jgi:hypothetical protein
MRQAPTLIHNNLRKKPEDMMVKASLSLIVVIISALPIGMNANCYTEDALYTEPPDKQVYAGRKALYEFFGGDKKPDPPMRMTWHHLAFDEESQTGFGEYTFQMNNRYHGIVVVKIRDGKISNWREYQYKSDMEWREFVKKNDF